MSMTYQLRISVHSNNRFVIIRQGMKIYWKQKALQYFSQLCNADNPYARKVAAFNQQFLKLAAQTIAKNHNARSQGIGEYQPSQLPEKIIEQIDQNKSQKQQNKLKQQSNYASVSIKNIYNERHNTDTETKSNQSQIHSQSDAISTTTATSIKKSQGRQNSTSRVSGQIKLNLGAKKNQKTKMKDMMKNLLANTKVEQQIYIKRNSNMPAHTNLTTNKKYHIPGQKHQNLQLNTHKSSKSKKSIESNSHKSIKEDKKKIVKSQSQQNKRKQIQAKVNKQHQNQKGTVKLPKINQYKDLVQMVKQQQQQRKARANKVQNAQTNPKLPQLQTNNTIQGQQVIKEEIKIQQLTPNSKKQTKIHSKQDRNDQVIEQKIQVNDVIKQQPFEESLSPQKINKMQVQHIQNNRENGESQAQSKVSILAPNLNQQIKHKTESMQTKNNTNNNNKILISGSEQNIKNYKSQQIGRNSTNTNNQTKQYQQNKHQKLASTFKIQQFGVQNVKPQSSEIIQRQNKNFALQQNIKNNQIPKHNLNKQQNQNEDYTKKLIQQIEREQKNQYHFFGTTQDRNNEENTQNLKQESQIKKSNSQTRIYNDNQIQRPSSYNNNQSSPQNKNQQKQSIPKKCYSQEYWAHVRQEAQLKIKRFKQQKQFEQKRILAENSNNAKDQQQKQQQNISDSPTYVKLKQEQEQFEKQILKKQQQLVKMKKQLMKKTSKVVEATPVPKIIRPKPQFDYFQIYPTFNHIFSVMYLKPTSQAIAEIPNIMRDIKTMFQTHMEHFSSKNNFKPALFLPFDNNGTFQLTNPKQLIAHAQQTYIDLKIMIERVQIFNQNLHGDFSNGQDNMYYRVIKTKQQVYDIITTSFMRRKGWKQLPHGCSLRSSWNLFWSWSKPDIDLNKLLVWQKINHFPFNKNLSRKDLLYKNLDAFRKNFKVPMNFLPLTFNLPKQFSQLSAKFHEQQILNKDGNYWIMKPIGKSRGRGIKVVSSLSQLNYTDNIVVQKYIANPMLIDGYKFDMRIYVLVTSFHPLQAFVYKQGFARLSTQKYSLDPHSIKNTFVHLTNFAINKNNVSGNTNFAGGSKISLKTLKDRVTKMGHSFSNIWGQVHDIIVKSLLGCSVSVPSFPTAFELFGYDIMVDQECNCSLIQINASPSLQRSYMIDEIVKQNLIDDILDIVDPPDFDKKQLLDVFTERINAMTNKKKITQQDDLISLARILKYKPIRKLGESPSKMGLFQMVAPSQLSRELEKMIKAKSGANNPMNID